MKTTLSLIGLTVIVLAVMATAAGQANRSVYTTLKFKECEITPVPKSAMGDYEGKCPGIAGYTLLVSEGDMRQNLTVVTSQGAKHSLELWDVVSGGFSTVGPRAEWRMANQKGKLSPVALIVRYSASEDPEHPNKVNSYLAVSKITPTEICITDKISPGPKANEEARRAADSAATKPCLKQK